MQTAAGAEDPVVMLQIEKAVRDGFDVRGMFYWTLIDNFVSAFNSRECMRLVLHLNAMDLSSYCMVPTLSTHTTKQQLCEGCSALQSMPATYLHHLQY